MKMENLEKALSIRKEIVFAELQLQGANKGEINIEVRAEGYGYASITQKLTSSKNVIKMMVCEELRQHIEKLNAEYCALDAEGDLDVDGYETTDKSEGGTN